MQTGGQQTDHQRGHDQNASIIVACTSPVVEASTSCWFISAPTQSTAQKIRRRKALAYPFGLSPSCFAVGESTWSASVARPFSSTPAFRSSVLSSTTPFRCEDTLQGKQTTVHECHHNRRHDTS